MCHHPGRSRGLGRGMRAMGDRRPTFDVMVSHQGQLPGTSVTSMCLGLSRSSRPHLHP